MSSMISVPKSDLEMIFNLLGEKLSNSSGSSAVKLNKSGKPKKQNSNKGKPTCHGDFVKMICDTKKDEVAAFKAENPTQKGAHLIFVSNYKKEHKEEVDAFEADWKEKHPKDAASEAASDGAGSESGSISGGSASGKPKRIVSDDQKAKMKAGREAAAAKRKAEKEGVAPASEPIAPVTSAAPVVAAPSTPVVAAPVVAAPPESAKKPVKTAKKAAIITTPVVAPVEATPRAEMLPFKMGAITYLRQGTKRPDGNHLWTSGHLWQSIKGAKGAHIGELQDNGEIDESATEPSE